ncbi:MAG: hypothetical protein KUG77_02795, partial [Nannocystaceae bacterium]|nr:hypothetical protein [Nannocystaceae bacterium]
ETAQGATEADMSSSSDAEPTTSATDDGSSGGEPKAPDTRRCIPPTDVSASPRTIEEAVVLLNALPAPVDIACFLESLERPLKIVATSSTFSAQPAFGAENPRVFLFAGDLVMSVVPAGEGVRLLEFGEFVDEFQTVKGEVELPLEGELAPSDPYSRILFEAGSGCGLCHRNEHEVGTLDGVTQYASLAYQPALHHALDEEDVREAYEACADTDSERCEILSALFDHGPVLFTVFPEDLPTFGG